MGAAEIWAMIHDERRALAADLEGLDEARWDTPSLCAGWSVRDTLAHLTSQAKLSVRGFLGGMIKSGFNLQKMQAKHIAANRGTSGPEALGLFKDILPLTKSPPGPKDTWLGEAIVHAEDIRRPLGIDHQYPTAALVRVADFYKGSNLIIGAKKRIAGLRMRATDADWSTGSGPEVRGPLKALVSAMTGRKAALDDLEGDGVSTLASRD